MTLRTQPNCDDTVTARPHALTHPARPEHMAGQGGAAGVLEREGWWECWRGRGGEITGGIQLQVI
jgi:hypothetical protein